MQVHFFHWFQACDSACSKNGSRVTMLKTACSIPGKALSRKWGREEKFSRNGRRFFNNPQKPNKGITDFICNKTLLNWAHSQLYRRNSFHQQKSAQNNSGFTQNNASTPYVIQHFNVLNVPVSPSWVIYTKANITHEGILHLAACKISSADLIRTIVIIAALQLILNHIWLTLKHKTALSISKHMFYIKC